jgi:hypothetical protein
MKKYLRWLTSNNMLKDEIIIILKKYRDKDTILRVVNGDCVNWYDECSDKILDVIKKNFKKILFGKC